MNVIFLDIDGVLNTHEPLHPEVMCGQIHRDKVERLNAVLKITDARIVLSSAWRYIVHRGEATLTGMRWLLRSHGILDRLIGITRPDTMMPAEWTGKEPWPVENERGRQISDFLATFTGTIGTPCSRYVVVDDLDLGITDAGHPFVKVDGTKGYGAREAGATAVWLTAAYDPEPVPSGNSEAWDAVDGEPVQDPTTTKGG